MHLTLLSNDFFKEHPILKSVNMNSSENPETLLVTLKEDLPQVLFPQDYYEMPLSAVSRLQNIAGLYQLQDPSTSKIQQLD